MKTISRKVASGVRQVILALALAAVGAGCAGKSLPPDSFHPVTPDSASYAKGVDTFIVVLDTGSSMEETYRKRREAFRAEEIVARLNQMVPALDYRAGLIAFDTGSCLSCEDARVIYGPALYNRAEFAAGLADYATGARGRRFVLMERRQPPGPAGEPGSGGRDRGQRLREHFAWPGV